ncbi:MAG: leucine-rich repeat protein [Lachnospiraceae bacterium]|nr:leucine-rich repeat protein [Lachnospiraceae bacterium]
MQKIKKINKLIITTLIALTMAITINIVEAKAEETYGDWGYEVLTDGTLMIVSYTGDEINIDIPEKIKGKTVTQIYSSAFSGRQYDGNMATVSIPATINYIEDYAFSFGYIEKIDVSESNPYYCVKDGVLYDKNMKTLIFYPNKYGKFNIPNGVETISYGAFDEAISLTEIYIPKSVKNVEYAFGRLPGLKSVEVSDKNTKYSSVDGVIFNKKGTELIYYPTAKHISYETYYVPNKVKTISSYAFAGCYYLRNIYLPEGLTTIESGAFSDIIDLEYVYIPKSTKNIGGLKSGEENEFFDYAFDGCNNLTICSDKNSFAKEYAEENNISWEEAVFLKNAKVKLEKTSYEYDKNLKLPNISIKYKNKELKKYQDYVITYKNNKNIGKATVIIQGQGKYIGTIKKTFTIKPKKISGLKQEATKKKTSIKMTWKKSPKVTGYEVYRSTKVNGTYKKIKSLKNNSYTNKKLKSDTEYYYKVRAYKTVKGKKIYSQFSKTVVMKTK